MTESKGRQQRRLAGKEVRKKVPRESLGMWAPPADRRDPVQILIDQGDSRVADLIPIRYARMLSSEFAFYRGAAAVMASDLSYSPNTHLTVQLAGDAHLSNFGGYASPDRTFVFDVNDFDETLPGPFEWDLKRLVASFAVAGRSNGFDEQTRAGIIGRVVRTYRESVQTFSQMPRMDVWYSRLTAQDIIDKWSSKVDKSYRKAFEKQVEKAQTKTSQKALQKLTSTDADGTIRFLSNPPFMEPFDEVVGTEDRDAFKYAAQAALVEYRRSLISDRRVLFSGYRVVDLARKVVGVGSVGTRCWVMLLMADHDESDVLMLQLKEAQASVLEQYLGRSRAHQHGRRVVEGQRVMQAASDILLGWTQVTVRDQQVDFYVRQMWDWKESADISTMDATSLEIYAHLCGWTLARAHSRSGDRVALAGYLGTSDTLDRVLTDFAEAYADQNVKDHAALQEAASAGRIQVAASGW
ncbi:MAG: DUF2252 domain-containing protein [Actinobacteria bacterium]|nr:DUF2252 domain-containing protein [Actinomycetota bacterium]MCB8997690.1 DUF2252 domain-containing protein [Actinomycetota bacterium]MCB9423923.1 DUF2252 domain-containing protein [Actinomycetota bacterium]HRY09097.1 DUF2252 domain-containing protein [Candidatus Nanopelagicales bacterium]